MPSSCASSASSTAKAAVSEHGWLTADWEDILASLVSHSKFSECLYH